MVYLNMIEREARQAVISIALERSPVVLLSGPRQCGKTTLARTYVDANSVNYFDLEDPTSAARLEEPMTALAPLRGIVVIDEIQRRPDLFPVLRVLADRVDEPATFLVLGSASGDLLRQSSESLAGRVEIIPLQGFSLQELGTDEEERLWLRGGFPRSFLARTDDASKSWRQQFIQTLLERDLPMWGVRTPSSTMLRFWMMVAHYHGQIWNSAEPARSLGSSEHNIRGYLDVLTDAFMVRQLQPYHANVLKRQVKSPKIYVRDCGLLHRLLSIDSMRELVVHPKLGASWEGFVIENVLSIVQPDASWFWATHNGAEIDLVMQYNGRLIGVECKRSDAPRVTPSMQHALQDLHLERIVVIYPGNRAYSLRDDIIVAPFTQFCEDPDTFLR
ncbi:ATP-binding protein [soil metagenome]